MGEMTVYGGPGFEESVSAVTADPSVDLGSRRLYKGEEYVYCYNAGGTTIAKTYGVKLITGASGYSVADTALTNVANICVGVVKHEDLEAADYGWIMTKGFTQVEHAADSASVGNYIAISLARSGTFHQAAPLTDAVHVGTFAVCGYGLAVSAASGDSFYAMINTGF